MRKVRKEERKEITRNRRATNFTSERPAVGLRSSGTCLPDLVMGPIKLHVPKLCRQTATSQLHSLARDLLIDNYLRLAGARREVEQQLVSAQWRLMSTQSLWSHPSLAHPRRYSSLSLPPVGNLSPPTCSSNIPTPPTKKVFTAYKVILAYSIP